MVFGHYEVREIVRAVEKETIKKIGPPHRKRLDRGSAEILVGWLLRDLLPGEEG